MRASFSLNEWCWGPDQLFVRRLVGASGKESHGSHGYCIMQAAALTVNGPCDDLSSTIVQLRTRQEKTKTCVQLTNFICRLKPNFVGRASRLCIQ